MEDIRHKVFISYHHDDEEEVKKFINTFDKERKVFITRILGAGMSSDIIKSTNTDYVMRRIRQLYLQDSTVTIVMLGKCTWARRYIDWEIKASLTQGSRIPNGLLGIKLPSYHGNGYPKRLNENLKAKDSIETDCYARAINYPRSKSTLRIEIEDAYKARTDRDHLIKNSRDRFLYNRNCV